MSEQSLDRYRQAYEKDFTYDFDNRLILNWYPQRILEKTSDGALLELGVGHGYSTVRFAERFSRHVVLDGAPSVIEQFRRAYPSCPAEIVQTYFEDFSTTEQFDVVVMGFVLEHVTDPLALLRQYRSFMKADGRLFVAVPNAAALNKRIGLAAGLLDDLQQLSEGDRALGHLRLFTVESLRQLVLEANYSVRGIEGIFLKPLTTSQMQQLNFDEKVLQGFLEVGINYPELCVGILLEAAL